ncbi:hypothetical protein SAMN04488542_10320 [Fontibacillus panacisegetis]|uniref:DUF2178 domain-containing protein n=1 Tax=Fontibacillus panacisegetis TaxID=670482 RepID=A0A1G7GF49_9BACL|nr:hypothetical protein [Fontibacillus panacisegetis]SDE86721.1 hypothetical protein SAMN04488542_10320 [Fontibacillus panacisegetis]
MKNYKSGKYIVFSVIGLMIFTAGLVLIKSMPDTQDIMRVLPYLCIGIGAGIFGQNLGEVLKNIAVKNNPEVAKQMVVEANDERNLTISNKAKAKAYDLMLMVFSALMLTFALMQVNMYLILAFVAAYLFIVFSQIYYLNKYQKEM